MLSPWKKKMEQVMTLSKGIWKYRNPTKLGNTEEELEGTPSAKERSGTVEVW